MMLHCVCDPIFRVSAICALAFLIAKRSLLWYLCISRIRKSMGLWVFVRRQKACEVSVGKSLRVPLTFPGIKAFALSPSLPIYLSLTSEIHFIFKILPSETYYHSRFPRSNHSSHDAGPILLPNNTPKLY